MNQQLGAIMIAGTLLINLAAAEAGNAKQAAPAKERVNIEEKYKWNVSDIFKSDEAWRTAKEAVVKRFDLVDNYKGKLGSSAKTLAECLQLIDSINLEMVRLYSYASLNYDTDMRVSENQAMKAEISQIWTDFSSKTAFVEPEILEMSAKKIEKYIAKEAGLADYDFYLRDIVRRQPHTLSSSEEEIVARAGLISGAPYDIFGIFSNADLPYPTVKLSDGTEVRLDAAGYSRYRAVPNRADREIVFEAFFGKLEEFKRTMATQLAANVKSDLFYSQVRKYSSCLESSLADNNIPTEVYYSLIKNVNDNLGTFHRYLKLRAKIMGVDQLNYYDLYAPVVKDVEAEFSYVEAQKLIQEALQPLGTDYTGVIAKAFNDRWIDVYPTTGKRSGAYSSGNIHDLHPYILLNYNGQYDDVSTLAHELGHTMHSYYSNKNQPFAKADYSIFVAEVASTFNEILLFQDYLQSLTSDDERLSLLMSFLDGIKGTLFRQTMFAEFELKIHDMVEKGEQLTGDVLNKEYGELVRRYCGEAEGACIVPKYIDVEWAYIPHFYYNFYVYQYATSYTASTALSEKVLSGDKEALANYINFISSGGSDYPINILKKAGVDMTGSEPFDLTIKKMNWAMDEIEKILSK